MKKIIAGVFCLVVIGALADAQSIYSFQGLGSLNHQGMPNNVAMGEVGIGSPQSWHINTQNPANLVYTTLSTFQVGLEVDRRRFSGDGVSGSDAGGGLRFLGYSFPIKPGRWTSAFGILPYSSVNYNSFSQGDILDTDEATQVIDNRGEGGLTNFYWANGFVIKKTLFFGVKATYTFGAIDKESTIFISGTDIPVSAISYSDQESYSDLNFLFGLSYRHALKGNNKYLNFGLTYSPKSKFNGTSELSLIRLNDITGNPTQTQEVASSSISQDLPQTIGFGLSYQKLNNYLIGLDFETQQWSKAESGNESFNNFYKIAIGAEWVPDYDDISSYLQRIKYSVGFNRTRLPYIVNNQALIDFGINFGASLPVSGVSSLDLAFKWGQLGETSNGLIRENYYKIVIGATINDRWFIQRRYD